jgi:hypothetical protein
LGYNPASISTASQTSDDSIGLARVGEREIPDILERNQGKGKGNGNGYGNGNGKGYGNGNVDGNGNVIRE